MQISRTQGLGLRRVLVLLCFAALVVSLAHGAPAHGAPTHGVIDPALREVMLALERGERLPAGLRSLRARQTLAQLYRRAGHSRLWNENSLRELRETIDLAVNDGLNPSDYHRDELQRLAALAAPGAEERLRQELLASDAYALLLQHLYYGKLDPVTLDPNWNFSPRSIDGVDAIGELRTAILAGRIHATAERARPGHWMYAAGREALAKYRLLAAQGGWPRIPSGKALSLGMRDSRVPLLRRWLIINGDLAMTAEPADALLFDAELDAALRRAQRRHRLAEDGVLGLQTLRALNVPIEQRIDQLRVNLERGRQVLHEIGDEDLVIIDIAGFEVHYIRARKRVWVSRAIVGQSYRKTPIFKSRIDSVMINPSWTVPPGILAKDILPSLRSNDRSILERKGLQVLDREGRVLDADAIDFRGLTAKNFPYLLRQPPGPNNALGVVKIDFPNPHLVYLHDTPSKSLFAETQRTFSSGCIRTERAVELAELLLGENLRSRIDSGQTQKRSLRQPVDVLLIYWTADRDDDGGIVFKPDPYRRDARELAALDQSFRTGQRRAP